MLSKKHLALMMAVLLLLAGCGAEEAEETPELLEPVGVTMDTAEVIRQDMAKTSTYTGVMQPASYELVFEQAGTLETLYVSYGDTVEEGDVLAELSQEALETEVENLEEEIAQQEQINALTIENLELEVEIAQNTLDELNADGASESEITAQTYVVEEKELNLQQEEETQSLEMTHLQEELADLKEQLGQNTLTAPCSGTIVYVDSTAAVGANIEAYTTMFVVTDDTNLYAITSQIKDATLENAVSVTAEIGGETYNVTSEPYSTEELLTMLLDDELETKSRFIVEGAEDLTAGETVVITVTIVAREDVLTVPVNALYTDTTGRYVYVVEDGKRTRTSVQVGLTTDTLAEITDGLEEGDEVYVQND